MELFNFSQKRIEENKKKTADLINKIGTCDIKDEDNPDLLFKMPEKNDSVDTKKTGYEIFMSEEKGRGIRATRDFKPGNLIISAEPFAFVIFEQMAEHVCHYCFNMVVRDKTGKGMTTLLRCSSCKFARYCSRECQKKAWPQHKKECMAIRVSALRKAKFSNRMTKILLTEKKNTKIYNFLNLKNIFSE